MQRRAGPLDDDATGSTPPRGACGLAGQNLTTVVDMTPLDASTGFDLAAVDKLLMTTRSVRKRLDLSRPVPLDVVRDCLRIALQAPTGSNFQGWRWLVVVDADVRHALAELYQNPPATTPPVDPALYASPQQQRMMDSARYLMGHIQEVPIMVVPCVQEEAGAAGWAPSIYPAVWSFLLALRSRGLGSVITTAHLYREAEAAELLGVPAGYAQACLLPVAYYTGKDFKPAVRRPVEDVCFLDRWGAPLPPGP
jgi:nitroreductase